MENSPYLFAQTLEAQFPLRIAATPLGKGGEGAIYEVEDVAPNELCLKPSQFVVKLYHADTNRHNLAHKDKLWAMLANPPTGGSVAWPEAVICDDKGYFCGYLMPKLNRVHSVEWLMLANTRDRLRRAPDFSVRYALQACYNLAVAINTVHTAGHAIGDINESNIFVSDDASIMIVDSDSFQIKGDNGQIYRCEVGKPEFTAPELSNGSLRDQVRTGASDVFALAVCIFQMLTGGAHPTDGRYLIQGETPSVVDRTRQGIYPALGRPHPEWECAARIPTQAIPVQLRKVLITALNPTPSARITLGQLADCMAETINSLTQCPKVANHWYDQREGNCGWCRHAATGQLDPWNPVFPKTNSTVARPKQQKLPPVEFNQNISVGSPKPRTAAVPTANIANVPSGLMYPTRIARSPLPAATSRIAMGSSSLTHPLGQALATLAPTPTPTRKPQSMALNSLRVNRFGQMKIREVTWAKTISVIALLVSAFSLLDWEGVTSNAIWLALVGSVASLIGLKFRRFPGKLDIWRPVAKIGVWLAVVSLGLRAINQSMLA